MFQWQRNYHFLRLNNKLFNSFSYLFYLSKLPFHLSFLHAGKVCYLLHADIWEPYRASTRDKYMHFLTLVDVRMIWVCLQQMKSKFLKSLKAFYVYVIPQFTVMLRFRGVIMLQSSKIKLVICSMLTKKFCIKLLVIINLARMKEQRRDIGTFKKWLEH